MTPNMKKGILYVAYGPKAIAHVERGIIVLRKYNRKLPVAVISDQNVKGCTILIKKPDADIGARTYKTTIYFLSPFEQTLYLDADTELLCDPGSAFKLLNYADMAMAQDPIRIFNRNKWKGLVAAEIKYTIEATGGGELCYYNDGVILFKRNARVEALMKMWHEEWKRFKRQDQPAMLRAMYQCPVKLITMREEFNTHKQIADFVKHYHRRASRPGAPK